MISRVIVLLLALFLLQLLLSRALQDPSESWAEQLYDLSKSRFTARNNTLPKFDRLHLLRVPKAGSTALSVVARRMAGCYPAGPCCKYPGTPPGSCPSPDLFKCEAEEGGPLVGCTHHRAHPDELLSAEIPSISMMREPVARAISAFNYPGIHHNSKCTGSRWAARGDRCFKEYTADPRWRNVAVKMFSGCYAYSNDEACEHAGKCKCSLHTALAHLEGGKLAVVGVMELWELSMVLLHERFPHFSPSFDEFQGAAAIANTTSSSGGVRARTVFRQQGQGQQQEQQHEVKQFTIKSSSPSDMAPAHYAALVQQSGLDSQLYQAVLRRMQAQLKEAGLLAHPVISRYWQEKAVPLLTVV